MFPGLDAAGREAVEGLFRVRRFHRGERLLIGGDSGAAVLVVLAGRLRVAAVSPGGREITLHRYCAGGVAGLQNLAADLDGSRSSAEVIAETDGRLAAAPAAGVLDAMAAIPSLGRAFLGEALRQLRDAEELARRVSGLPVDSRVAAALLELALPAEGARVLREELACRVGATRESVSRALRRFACRGAIALSGRSISVTDAGGLRRIAGGEAEPVPCYGSPGTESPEDGVCGAAEPAALGWPLTPARIRAAPGR